jgi:AcrR family transcriptional regulator
LLETACGVFAKRGFEAATLEQIAEQAGVSRPILYNHFGNKQGLFEAVVAAEIARVEAVVAEALAGAGDPREILERGQRAFFRYVREHPDGHGVLTRDAPIHLSDSGLGVMVEGLAKNLTEVIAAGFRSAGLDSAPAPLYAYGLIGLNSMVGRWWHGHPEMSLDAVTDLTTSLLWNGFSGLGESP